MLSEARAAGQEVSSSWLFQYERLQTLERQVEAEIRQSAQYAEQLIIADSGSVGREPGAGAQNQ